jgi:hypothetical protein
MNRDNGSLLLFFLLGVLIIVALFAYGILSALRQTSLQAQQAIRPVGELTGNLATQVARLLNPTPTVRADPVAIVNKVAALARLETIQYSIEKVITAESGQDALAFLFGDRLLFVAHGTVIAGLDLAKLQPGDLEVRGEAVVITLPDPQIFIVALDNQKSYVYDRDTGLLNKGNLNLESTARQAAEAEIRKAAIEDGILGQARINGENYLYRFLRELGFGEVIFNRNAPLD